MADQLWLMKRIREEDHYALQPAENHVHQGVIFCIQNVLKFTYNNLEFPNFPGEAEDPWTHFFSGEGQGGRGRKGRGPSVAAAPGPVGPFRHCMPHIDAVSK